MAKRYVSDFVKADRESKQRFVRVYSPHSGQRFRFAGNKHEVWIRHPETGAIMRETTYQARR